MERKLQNMGGVKFFVCLPKRDIELLGWKPRDLIHVDLDMKKKTFTLKRVDS